MLQALFSPFSVQFHKAQHIPGFNPEGPMTVSYLVTTYVLTLCACQISVSLMWFFSSFQEWLETGHERITSE